MKQIQTKTILLLVSLLFSFNLIFAKDYFVSNNGNDSNTGTSMGKPWRTIEKINQTRLYPGDKILFNRGDEFYGEIVVRYSGSEQNPILFSAYGEGNKPVLKGSVSINNWKREDGKKYKATVNDSILNFYVDGVMQTSARYPNSGFLFVDEQIDPDTKFYDADLPGEDNYWNGAMIRYRTCDWVTRHGVVTAHENKCITLREVEFPNAKTVDQIVFGSGYYFDNKFEELDSISEWFYNPDESALYFMPGERNIQNINAEGVALKTAFTLLPEVSHIEISDLSIKNFFSTGIDAQGKNKGIYIIDNDFVNINSEGIHFAFGASNCLVKGNVLKDILGRGIYFIEASNCSITENQIKNIGLKYGYGISGLNGMIGIIIVNSEKSNSDNRQLSTKNTISYNRLENIGYNGIRMDGNHSKIHYNLVDNAVCRLNDGSGIYCWAGQDKGYTAHNVILGNIVANIKGNKTDGLNNHFHLMANGIYADNRTEDITIEDNVIANITSNGVFLNAGCKNSKVLNNTIFNASIGILANEYWNLGTKGNVVTGNTVFVPSTEQYCVGIKNHSNFFTDSVASFQNNNYYSLYENNVAMIMEKSSLPGVQVKQFYSMGAWQKRNGQDTNSVRVHFTTPYDPNKQSPFYGPEIIINDSKKEKEFDFGEKTYYDLEGNSLGSTFSLKPFDAIIVLRKKQFLNGENKK